MKLFGCAGCERGIKVFDRFVVLEFCKNDRCSHITEWPSEVKLYDELTGEFSWYNWSGTVIFKHGQ